MSFRTILAAAAILVAAGGSAAYAREQQQVVTVTLAAPAADARVIADSAIWNCADTTCRAIPVHSVSVHSCRQFARFSHARVTAFGSEDRQLSADELARCNGDAAPGTLQANATGH